MSSKMVTTDPGNAVPRMFGAPSQSAMNAAVAAISKG